MPKDSVTRTRSATQTATAIPMHSGLAIRLPTGTETDSRSEKALRSETRSVKAKHSRMATAIRTPKAMDLRNDSGLRRAKVTLKHSGLRRATPKDCLTVKPMGYSPRSPPP